MAGTEYSYGRCSECGKTWALMYGVCKECNEKKPKEDMPDFLKDLMRKQQLEEF